MWINYEFECEPKKTVTKVDTDGLRLKLKAFLPVGKVLHLRTEGSTELELHAWQASSLRCLSVKLALAPCKLYFHEV